VELAGYYLWADALTVVNTITLVGVALMMICFWMGD
jgi:hypothetical protein